MQRKLKKKTRNMYIFANYYINFAYDIRKPKDMKK